MEPIAVDEDDIFSTIMDTMYKPPSVLSNSSASPSPTFTNVSPPTIPNLEGVRIKIVEQPAMKGLRFRYICEGRSAGSIPGVHSTPENKTFPTIEIEGYDGKVKVIVSCVTKDEPYRPHPHNLVGKEGCEHGVCMATINGPPMRAVFSNLGIQCVKKKDIKAALEERERKRIDPFKTSFCHKDQPSSIDLNVVRLCFQAFIPIPGLNKYYKVAPVVSDPIFDKKSVNDLCIHRLCTCHAKVTGGDSIILLCDKVTKDDIKIRFFELRNNEVYWEDFGQFGQKDVYNQTGIMFKTPRYINPDVNHSVQVFIQLYRPSDGETSNAIQFELHPDLDPDNVKRKRIRTGGNLMNIFREIQQLEQNEIQYNISNSPNTESSSTWNILPSMPKPLSSNTLAIPEVKPEPFLSPNYYGDSHRYTYAVSPSSQPTSPMMNRCINTPSPGLMRNSSGESQTQMSCLYNQSQVNQQEQYQNLPNNFSLSTSISCTQAQGAIVNINNECNNGKLLNTTNTFFDNSNNNHSYNIMKSPQPQTNFPTSSAFVNRTSGGSFTPIYPTNDNTIPNDINSNINIPLTQFQSLNVTSNIQQVQEVLETASNHVIFNQFQSSNLATDSSLFNLDDLVPLQNSEELRMSNLSITT